MKEIYMRHMSQEVGVLGVSHECVAKASKYPYYMRLVSQNYLLCMNTFPCNPHKIIDLIDPRSHPQGVPQFQAQYIKLNTPPAIAILIIFTYMVANEVL